MNTEFGFLRITTAVPRVTVADPVLNTDAILKMLRQHKSSDVVVFPELAVSSYCCGDLFHHKSLLDGVLQQIERIASEAPVKGQVVMVGAPISHGDALYNCVVVINDGKVVGVVPKQFLPNYKEFYEARWFSPGRPGLGSEVRLWSQLAPFGTELLFASKPNKGNPQAVIFAEICEAIWMPIPPSSMAALAGANVICNLSASDETVGKADYRRGLVTGQSGRCICAYAYTSSGPTESTSDVVYGGHAMIAEAGMLLAESTRVGDTMETQRDAYSVSADVDIERLQTERRTTVTFADSKAAYGVPDYRQIEVKLNKKQKDLLRFVPAKPFVPAENTVLHNRCAEVFGIQTAGLAKRLECLGAKPQLTIGISGGLDSTLALLVATKACDSVGISRRCIRAVTMPGFGTTDKTLRNAHSLMKALGVTVSEMDIRESVLLEFKELSKVSGYKPFGKIKLDPNLSVDGFVKKVMALPKNSRQDLVFENVQARRRTALLMNMGFVLGTGDMSELWLGWCTYNADHQSMYNVNCSVPKTLVKFLVKYLAKEQFTSPVRETLLSIAETAISPELLPPTANGKIAQNTEETVGPYELHDFFLYHIARHGFSADKIQFLAKHAQGWDKNYTAKEISHWLKINLERAFSQQYKRDDVPNGPKVGSVSLSPRGDWRMPSDASVAAWIQRFS